jgi:CheY-like chemotaxis protein
VLLPSFKAVPDAEHSLRPSEAKLSTGAGLRLMIVDDEPSVARVTGLMMKRLGHKVRTFSDPVLALKELDRSPVDCLITDHSMPGMTGTELTAAARGLYPDLPVIICSGYGARLNEQLVLGSGARALLWKPLDFTHLGEVVESIAINPHPRP